MAAPNILCDTAGMTNAQWLAARMHGPSGKIPYTVGGSDVAAVFGVSPWTTPLELWMIKKGRMKPPAKSNANQLEMGHLLEPIAAHWYAKKTGNRVYEDTNLYQHADHPYALANFDRRFERASDGEPGILECKSCTYHKASEWDDGAIPLYYELQLRFYLAVADVNIGSFSAIWGNKPGAEFLYNGIIYRVGDVIIGSDQSEYAGLIGSIFEIRDGSDKETENDTPDIYCSFDPPVLPMDIAKVEAVFSDLYGTQKILDDICFDMVIMAPEMITVPGQSKKSVKLYILSEDWAAHDNYKHLSGIYSDPLEARARLNEALGNEIDFGCLSDWINTPEYRTETSENSYEGWLDGFYCESHYAISLEEHNVVLTPSLIKDLERA